MFDLSLGIFIIICACIFLASELILNFHSIYNRFIILLVPFLVLLSGGYFLTEYSGGEISWNEIIFSEIWAMTICNVSVLTFVVFSKYHGSHLHHGSIVKWTMILTSLAIASYFIFSWTFLMTILGTIVIVELFAFVLLGLRKGSEI